MSTNVYNESCFDQKVMEDIATTKKDKIEKRKETKRVLVKIAAFAGWCYYSYALPCKFLVLTLAPVKKIDQSTIDQPLTRVLELDY